MATDESRDDLKRRLKKAGHWDQAVEWFRDCRNAADYETTWNRLRYTFPKEGGESPSRAKEDYDLSADEEAYFASLSDRTDMASDIEWVYNHIRDHSVRALDAPSRGAWFQLLSIRSLMNGEKDGIKWFYKDLVRSAMQVLHQRDMKAKEETDDYVPSKIERKQIDELRQMFEDIASQSKRAVGAKS